LSRHESIKDVLITLGLESLENEDDRSEVDSLVVCEWQVCSSMAQEV